MSLRHSVTSRRVRAWLQIRRQRDAQGVLVPGAECSSGTATLNVAEKLTKSLDVSAK